MEKIKSSNPIYPAMGRTRIAQAIKPKGEERMTTEIQGNPSKDIINQPQNMTEITKANDRFYQNRLLIALRSASKTSS